MGRFKNRKTGRRQGGKGTEQSTQFDALLFYFRLEQAGKEPFAQVLVEQVNRFDARKRQHSIVL